MKNLRTGQYQTQDRGHFFAIAARAMRHVLVELARKRLAQPAAAGAEQLVEIGRLVEELEKRDPDQARILGLHYFSGFTYDEIAESTGLSRRRVLHLWELGSNWLKERLKARPLAYEVIQRAVEVIGDEPEAMPWLGTPTRALDYSTPVSLLHTREGIASVLVALGRLEHGVL